MAWKTKPQEGNHKERKIVRKKKESGGIDPGDLTCKKWGLQKEKGTAEDEVIIRHTVEENFLGRPNSPY